ncbi:sensor histidine kinase [Arthrobacter sp. 35W]|uniref:sensor histidine kinase n=1 Tax=Arthrobacter sp. 35W TaxID=1132441 RepID=UPI000416662C|nr:histidine kinase [Arthrobacter sp. 35W]
MPDSFPVLLSAVLLAAAAVVLLGAGVAGALGFRLSRRRRELGTDAERATYTTLHLATVAGGHLRNGLEPAGAMKASKALRSMLHCTALALTDESAPLAWDAAARTERSAPRTPSAARSRAVMALAARALATGRTQVCTLDESQLVDLGLAGADHGVKAAVASPIQVDARVVGCVLAFTKQASPALVRAANEVAGWISAQVQLAELGASRTLLMEAEVRALRAQISPHFIYNSLNAIASFINTDPVRARELVVEFADFTRYSFRRHGDFTTLAEELLCIDRYLLLERARFGERLQVNLQIAPEVLGTVIPFLSLQPLVENAVRHGLEAKEGVGHIKIMARDQGALAEVTIEDDGVGIDPEHLRSVLAGHRDGDHVGLRNVDARLRQVYGDDFGLVIDTAPGAGTLVAMRVPKSQPDHDA